MSDNQTVATDASVDAFLEAVEHPTRRQDGHTLRDMMQDITGVAPRMWGASLVGFGTYHYVYDSGREGDFFKVGFSPRKSNLVLYIMPGFEGQDALLERLGPHKTGSSCLYITRLARIDEAVLRELVAGSWQAMTARYG